MNELKHDGRGGRREGAGRKPSPGAKKAVTVTLRISNEAKQTLRERAAAEGKSIGQLIEDTFAN